MIYYVPIPSKKTYLRRICIRQDLDKDGGDALNAAFQMQGRLDLEVLGGFNLFRKLVLNVGNGE